METTRPRPIPRNGKSSKELNNYQYVKKITAFTIDFPLLNFKILLHFYLLKIKVLYLPI